MQGNLTLEMLKHKVADHSIDTVLSVLIDMQGRLMGKRFHAQNFLEHGVHETHCCNYLLATDMEMEPVSGYKAASWSAGYGDYVMKPDLSTLRLIPWLEGTALVICDVHDHHSGNEIAHSPRAILKAQIKRLADMDMVAMMATELEFFLFKHSFDEAQAKGYRELALASAYNEDYHIFQTSKEEPVMRAIRNGLFAAAIPVENSKGEASAGQAEINIRYTDALRMADYHALTKNAVKEIAWQQGRAVTFMAKWHNHSAGSSSHIHQSLCATGGQPLFFDETAPHGMSELMQHYLAGLLYNAEAITYFLAPNINSYKRFEAGTFAPTKAIWSRDNRTAGYRVCAEGSKAVRIECRVGGADLNPYLALAASIAAGIDGINNKRILEPEFSGDAYSSPQARHIPLTLRSAIMQLKQSEMLREAFGSEVIDHYVRAGDWEQEVFDQKVTDWEVFRGFERA